LGALLVFAGDNLELSAGFLERQLLSSWQERGRAAGAFDERGRQWAFAFLDEYTHEGMKLPGHWVRSVVVSPSARGLGLGRQVVALLLKEARALDIPRIFVDMRADNVRSRSLFEGLGFTQADFVLEAAVNDMLSSRLGPGSWKVLERELGAPKRS
jgi:ribosomal protein S18 acetylase RimI-like enzyme